jgi:hypothetical protein
MKHIIAGLQMENLDFLNAVAEIAGEIAGAPLDNDLEAQLNQRFPPGGEPFARLSALRAKGETEGRLMAREAGGIKFGGPLSPGTKPAGSALTSRS